MVFSCSTTNVYAVQQGDNYCYPDGGTYKFLYTSGDHIADGHLNNDIYACSRVYKITPGQSYILRLFSPSGSGYYNRFIASATRLLPDVGVYCNWTQNGENYLTHTASDMYYTFTAGTYDNYLCVTLNYGYDYDTIMKKMNSLNGGTNYDNVYYGLTTPLVNMSSVGTYYTTHGMPTTFNLSALGGAGHYTYDIYYSEYQQNDWTFIAESDNSGEVSYLVPMTASDLIDIRIGVRCKETPYFETQYVYHTIDIWTGTEYVPSVSDPLPIDSDISYDISDLPSVNLPSEDTGYLISGAFSSFPTEFFVFLVPSILISFVGWWLLK